MRRILAIAVGAWCAAGCFTKPPRPDDAPGDGAPADTGPVSKVHPMTQSPHARSNGSSLSYDLAIPDEPDRYLLVTVQIGTQCDDSAPAVTSVQADGVDLTMIEDIVGTICPGNTTSQQWELRAPPTGTLAIVIALAGPALSVHSAALSFSGVHQTTPTRESATAFGRGTRTSVQVASQDGDLVVNTLGHGDAITDPGPGQQKLFTTGNGNNGTLNNSAASIAAGAPLVEMTWDAVVEDEWQTISTPLVPSE